VKSEKVSLTEPQKVFLPWQIQLVGPVKSTKADQEAKKSEEPRAKEFLSLHPEIDKMVFTVNGVVAGKIERRNGKPVMFGRMVTEGKRVVEIEYNK